MTSATAKPAANADDALLRKLFQRAYRLTDAQMAESAERGRQRAAELAEYANLGTLPRGTRLCINENSTLDHVTQGTGAAR